jgi:hypothetical protein
VKEILALLDEMKNTTGKLSSALLKKIYHSRTALQCFLLKKGDHPSHCCCLCVSDAIDCMFSVPRLWESMQSKENPMYTWIGTWDSVVSRLRTEDI